MAFERLQLFGPVRLKLVEPGLDGDDRVGSQVEHADTGVARRSLVGDDPGLEKNAQMATHRRSGHPGGVGDLSCPSRSMAEQLHDLASRRISQRLEQPLDISNVHDNN